MTVTYSMPTAPSGPAPVPSDIPQLLGIANQIGNQGAQLMAQLSGIVQHDALYELVRIKNRRIRELRESIKGKFSGKVYLTDHIFHAVELDLPGIEVIFFNMEKIKSFEPNSIVIISNNNAMVDNSLDTYINLYFKNSSCIFAMWDFDNHHWFALSAMLAASCDVFAPSHPDNIELLSRFNNILTAPTGCATIQWSRSYLEKHSDLILQTEQWVDEPLGSHIQYPQFPMRQKNLEILNKSLAKVKLVDGSYHNRDMMDRFKEWCSHKVHWIVPVLNDNPIRVFDSLITGGIPIIPRSLKYHPDVIKLWDHVLFYDYEDIQNPLPITQKAKDLFDERGIQGVLDRHRLVCYNYHVDHRVEQILKAIYDEFGISPRSAD